MIGTKYTIDVGDGPNNLLSVDSTAYATAKLAGERLGKALTESKQINQFIGIRIGWCQPGTRTFGSAFVTCVIRVFCGRMVFCWRL